MAMGLFEAIRSAAAEVARRAQFVRIEAERLESFATELEGLRPPEGIQDPAQQPLADPETTAAFVLTMAAINFGSGYFPLLRKRPGCSGYFTISLALRERFEAKGPFFAEELVGLSASDCARLFGQEGGDILLFPSHRLVAGGASRTQKPRSSGDWTWGKAECPPIPQSAIGNRQSGIAELMGLFAQALNDLGRFLLAREQREQGDIQLFPKPRGPSEGEASSHEVSPISEQGRGKRPEQGDIQLFPKSRAPSEGEASSREVSPVSEQGRGKSRMSPFCAVVEAAGHSAERLVRLLAEMPFFRDVSDYEGLAVPFYKRAQLAAADLAQALARHPLGRFDDLAELTLFADNLVPHVLRVEGVLRHEAGLLARIEREELIAAGSLEEIEIRACAVEAVERLVARLRSRGRAATAHELDWLLWSRGQLPRYKGAPRHRTRTVCY